MTEPAAPQIPPPAPQRDLLDEFIDRLADRVVERLEEHRKIDAIAAAVIERIRIGAPYREGGAQAEPAADQGEGKRDGRAEGS